MIGDILEERYEIVGQVGEGGMGAVYEAIDRDEDRRVAVKVISDEVITSDATLLARFKREAETAAKVESPYVVEIFETGEHDGKPYIVMELLRGHSADQLLDEHGPLSARFVARIGIQAARGLQAAHAAAVVHRDVKPSNLIVTVGDERVVKLVDFGVAKIKMEQATSTMNKSLTRTGSVVGSPMYMSPEQARGLKTIDHRADVWSLGIVMFKLLAGKLPYDGIEGLGELIITICSEPPPLLSEVAPWVPKELEAAVAKALQLSPDDRFPSAEAFADALLECVDDDVITDEMVTSHDGDAEPLRTKPRLPSQLELDATVALPADDPSLNPLAPVAGLGGTIALEADELAEAQREDLAEARRAGSEPPPPRPDARQLSQRDKRAMERHDSARKHAIAAATTGEGEPKKAGAMRTILLALIVGLALGGVAVYFYLNSLDEVPTTPEPAP